MERQEALYWLKLCNVNRLGPRRVLKLIGQFGTVTAVAQASGEELLRSRIFTEEMLADWEKLKRASEDNFEKILNECSENGITMLPIFSAEYPEKLRELPSPPLNLFLQGDAKLLKTKKAAIVGSRQSGEDARTWVKERTAELVRHRVTIVSGGAVNIDYTAHRAALDAGGVTICVLGSGLLRPFPEEHTPLFNEIREEGLLVTEQIPSFPGSRFGLLQRNRITSGLSDAVIQVTCGLDGGSATQMNIAADQRIPLFCPAFELNFTPNDGLKAKQQEYRITEIRDSKPVLAELEKVKPKQTTLV